MTRILGRYSQAFVNGSRSGNWGERSSCLEPSFSGKRDAWAVCTYQACMQNVMREGIDNDEKIDKVQKCDLIPNTWQLWVY